MGEDSKKGVRFANFDESADICGHVLHDVIELLKKEDSFSDGDDNLVRINVQEVVLCVLARPEGSLRPVWMVSGKEEAISSLVGHIRLVAGGGEDSSAEDELVN